ncbi:MAG: glycoside hydrolase domain-containing protein, partial [Armatimonadota bacterium]
LPDGAIKWEFAKGADGQPTGEVKLDFATFDREGQRYFNEQQAFNGFNFAPYLWTRNDNKMALVLVDRNGTAIARRGADGAVNPVFDQVVIGVFRGIAAHFAQKGWLDRALYYVTDEPGEEDMPAIKEICELIRQADPRLRTALTYDPANRPKLAELVDAQGKSLISVWIPYCTMYNRKVADEQRAKGADYWLYDVSSTCLISMGGQTNRSLMWDIWRRGCHGYLYYLSTWWGSDVTPWDRPSFLLPGISYRYRQGDGYFFYPPERKYNPTQPILDHVVPTIRWEMLREGAEDYDYLTMLQDLTQRAAQRKLKVAAEGQAAVQQARDMSEIMSGIMEGHGIRDLTFKPTEGWGFGLEEGWLQGNSGKRVDLPISFQTSLADGTYRLVLNVYDDDSYRDLPYSRFLVNGKPYASSGGIKGPANVPTEIVTVKGGQCSFVLSSVADKFGVILYQVGLQPVLQAGRADLYTVRAKVADAIEHLQAALK